MPDLRRIVGCAQPFFSAVDPFALWRLRCTEPLGRFVAVAARIDTGSSDTGLVVAGSVIADSVDFTSSGDGTEQFGRQIDVVDLDCRLPRCEGGILRAAGN
jgi:hypothetical protein